MSILICNQHFEEVFSNVLPEYYKQFKRAETQFARYLSTGQLSAAKIAKEFYDESLAGMSKQLADSTTDFDVFALGLATVFLYFVSILIAVLGRRRAGGALSVSGLFSC